MESSGKSETEKVAVSALIDLSFLWNTSAAVLMANIWREHRLPRRVPCGAANSRPPVGGDRNLFVGRTLFLKGAGLVATFRCLNAASVIYCARYVGPGAIDQTCSSSAENVASTLR